ncbi:DUF4360 domain-containing protein [Pseudobdellovibrio sp. HCB154]|uniref:DUF4360 domain-containing protein n=1 Tax=Pseudobdellovibrio sp. HCB154 TaxID=3386277 RepID=UPI0039175532
MKTKHLIMLVIGFLISVGLASQAQAFNILKALEVQLPEIVQVGDKAYVIPASVKLVKLADGRFTTETKILGHKVGNGGDYIRSTFIQMGENVVEFLETTQEGQQVLTQHGLVIEDLKATLTTERIVVTNDILMDNTGSIVDAIGVPGLVILNSASWLDHFEKERNVYFIVFHEMLRSLAVNDDDYVISKDLINFPSQFKMSTRLLPLIPMLESDSITELVTLDNVTVQGSGCSAKAPAYTELDLTKNVIDITLKSFVVSNSEARKMDYKACNLSVPLKLPAGKRLTISLIDVSGEVRPQSADLQSTSTLRFEGFLAGQKGKVHTKTVALGSEARTVLFRKTDVITTGCGTSEILRLNVNNALASKGSAAGLEQNQSQIKKISVYLNLEDCQ